MAFFPFQLRGDLGSIAIKVCFVLVWNLNGVIISHILKRLIKDVSYSEMLPGEAEKMYFLPCIPNNVGTEMWELYRRHPSSELPMKIRQEPK